MDFISKQLARVSKLLVALICVAALVSCGGSSGGSSTGTGTYTFNADEVQLSATTGSFVALTVEVNGVAGQFLIDSGSEIYGVSTEFAERAGLERVGSTSVTTIAGTSALPTRRINLMRVGNVEVREVDAAEVFVGDFDGVIGAPFMRNVLIGIDYVFGVVLLANPVTTILVVPEGENAELMPIRDLSINNVLVNGRSIGPMRLDTGSNGGVHTSRAKGGSLLIGVTETRDETFTSFNGSVEGVSFIADTLNVGSFSLVKQLVAVQDPDIRINLLGNSVLQQFSVILNVPANEVIFNFQRPVPQTLRTMGSTIGRFTELKN